MIMGKSYQFSIELSPLVNTDNNDGYYDNIKPMLKFTNLISISSHPAGNSASGFERSFNLAQLLLAQNHTPKIDILIHVTCRDLNRSNVASRLGQLKKLGIERILVITGENYTVPDNDTGLYFVNSTELVSFITKHCKWFKSVAVAGYPKSTSLSSTGSPNVDYNSLNKKISLGADTIYTQCIFNALDFKLFLEQVSRKSSPKVLIIPSVAIFNNICSLSKCLALMRVQADGVLLHDLEQLKPSDDVRAYCKNFIVNLCRALKDSKKDQDHAILINFCAFGLFEFVAEIMETLYKDG